MKHCNLRVRKSDLGDGFEQGALAYGPGSSLTFVMHVVTSNGADSKEVSIATEPIVFSVLVKGSGGGGAWVFWWCQSDDEFISASCSAFTVAYATHRHIWCPPLC
jgi:hypothetical protein